MKRYILLEIDETGPKTRVDAVELDAGTGADIAEAHTAGEWIMGQAHGVAIAAAFALEELLR